MTAGSLPFAGCLPDYMPVVLAAVKAVIYSGDADDPDHYKSLLDPLAMGLVTDHPLKLDPLITRAAA
jgi:hypothetical protein